jgi:hypothetical protein
MEKFVKLIGFLIVPFLLLTQGCQKDSGLDNSSDSVPVLKSKMMNTFYGPTVPVGNGVARAWVTVDMNGDPTSAGINLSEKALEKLPAEPSSYVLDFPKTKGKNFYTHALLDWNPQGHEPPGTYDIPHFDFHFYIISKEARLAIGPNDTIQFANAPAAKYIPPFYIQIPGGVPQMGAHWADVLSPEFHGQVFTKTFIWGSYDGAFTFWEPMVSMNYLLSHPNDLVPLRQPSAYKVDGWYANSYKVAYSVNPNEYTVALTDLVFHNGE